MAVDSIVFGLLFLTLAIVLPGVGIQCWARLGVDPSLVLPLGATQAAAAYWVSLRLGRPWLFPVLLALSSVGVLLRGRLRTAATPPRAILAPALALVALLAMTQYGGNRPSADGPFLLDPMGDQPLHAGLAWELTLPYPPQVPGLAGVPLFYHYGSDLVRAAALRWAKLQPYDALSRFEPTLWAVGLMLALSGLTTRLGGSALAAALVPWTVLATDFSFLVALLGNVTWWSDVFRGNLLISVAFTNPVVPALMIALGSLIALSRYEAGEGRAWLGLAAAQAAAVPFFKVFLGAQLVLALGVAVLVGLARSKGPAPGQASEPWIHRLWLVVAALPGVLLLVAGPGGERVEVTFSPLRMVRDSLANLHIEGLAPGIVVAAAIPWLVISLGLRTVGLPRAGRALLDRSGAACAAATLALSGWPLGLLVHAAARDVEGRQLPTATIYFVEQSGAVLWLFAVMALAEWCRRRRRPAMAVAGAALLAFPSTLEFVVRKASVRPDAVPAAYVRAVEAVAKDGQPGDIVLQRPAGRYPPLPVVLNGRRVVYERFTPYLTQFAPASELRRRHEALFRFFGTRDRDEALAIARSLGARYLCLYGGDRIRFDGSGVLTPLHEEGAARSYRFDEARPSASQGEAASGAIR
jgi:hypothetical protein